MGGRDPATVLEILNTPRIGFSRSQLRTHRNRRVAGSCLPVNEMQTVVILPRLQ